MSPVLIQPSSPIDSAVAFGLSRYPSIIQGPLMYNSPSLLSPSITLPSSSCNLRVFSCQRMLQNPTTIAGTDLTLIPGMTLPTLPVLSPSGQHKKIAQPVSVIPHTCEIFASGANRSWKSAWVDSRNGEPPDQTYRRDRRCCLLVSGDVKIATIIAGTIGVSVI